MIFILYAEYRKVYNKTIIKNYTLDKLIAIYF